MALVGQVIYLAKCILNMWLSTSSDGLTVKKVVTKFVEGDTYCRWLLNRQVRQLKNDCFRTLRVQEKQKHFLMREKPLFLWIKTRIGHGQLLVRLATVKLLASNFWVLPGHGFDSSQPRPTTLIDSSLFVLDHFINGMDIVVLSVND